MMKIILTLLLLIMVVPLHSCGFATAPVKHGSAQSARLVVKTSDVAIAGGKKAAKAVTSTAKSVASGTSKVAGEVWAGLKKIDIKPATTVSGGPGPRT